MQPVISPLAQVSILRTRCVNSKLIVIPLRTTPHPIITPRFEMEDSVRHFPRTVFASALSDSQLFQLLPSDTLQLSPTSLVNSPQIQSDNYAKCHIPIATRNAYDWYFSNYRVHAGAEFENFKQLFGTTRPDCCNYSATRTQKCLQNFGYFWKEYIYL